MIEIISETGSTNADLIARLQRGEAPAEGHWLITRRQTQGRGRLGRAWNDGAGNFMGSTCIHVAPNDPVAHSLSFVAAIAVYRALSGVMSGSAVLQIKWPNDILAAGAKISGILLERCGASVVLGIGVNLQSAPDLEDRKTAAAADFGPTPELELFARSLQTVFAATLAQWRAQPLQDTLADWLVLAHPVGTPLQIRQDSGITSGQFGGLDGDGALLLVRDGQVSTIHAGDVMIA